MNLNTNLDNHVSFTVMHMCSNSDGSLLLVTTGIRIYEYYFIIYFNRVQKLLKYAFINRKCVYISNWFVCFSILSMLGSIRHVLKVSHMYLNCTYFFKYITPVKFGVIWHQWWIFNYVQTSIEQWFIW